RDDDQRVYEVGPQFQPRKLAAAKPGRVSQPRSGRRTKLKETASRGHYIGARKPLGDPSDLAVDATLRAAALRNAEQSPRPSNSPSAQDRERVRVRVPK